MATALNLQDETVSSSTTKSTGENAQSCSESPSTSNQPTAATLSAPGNEVLQRLAKQVEYYFSTTNLAKDTYLSTLRSLNDGYVPISIIANFGKVRSIAPYDGFGAVRTAAVDFSDLLEVVLINTKTGKRATADELKDSSLKTVEAVGPVSGQPIHPNNRPVSSSAPQPPAVPVNSTPSPVQSTIVLREVPQGIDETHLRQLFTFDKCPAIQSIHQDVANCWFVTLKTTSRDEMVDIMFELRQKKFESGEPVMARLKSGVAVNRDAATNVVYFGSDMMMKQATQTTSNRQNNNGGRKNKKKKNNNKSKQTTRSNNAQNNQNKSVTENKGKNNGGNNNRRSNNEGKQQKKPNEQQKQQDGSKSNNRKATTGQSPPPSLGEEQFPALPSEDPLVNSSKIEVEKVPEHDDLGKNPANSDASSTATTSTSSSKSPQPHIVMGGYAAALMKAAKAKPQPVTSAKDVAGQTNNNKTSKKNEKKTTTNGEANTAAKPKATPVMEELTPVNVQPPSWGRGSFADILRAAES